MTDLRDKVLYTLRMMRLARWLTETVPAEYRRRVLARAVFVYLDSFMKLAPRLKNELRKQSHIDVREPDTLLRQLRKDYDNSLDKIRDELSAHRQDISLSDLLDLWAEIDEATITILVDDASDVYRASMKVANGFPPITDAAITTDDAAIAALAKPLTAESGVEFTLDNLALGKSDSMGIVPIGDVQASASQIVSITNMINDLGELSGTVQDLDLIRLTTSLVIIEIFSLLENLYPSVSVSLPAHRPQSLRDALDQARIAGAVQELDAAERKLDRTYLASLRNVRNGIAAHVDGQQPLTQLLAQLDGVLTNIEPLNDLLQDTRDAFVAARQDHPTLKLLISIEGARLSDLTRVLPSDGYKPFAAQQSGATTNAE